MTAHLLFPPGPDRQLVQAIETHQPTALDAALRAGANVNAEAAQDATPLMVAVTLGHADTVQALLRRGARADWRGPGGRSPIWCAVQVLDSTPVRQQVVELLLAAGARLDTPGPDGNPLLMTPLWNRHAHLMAWLVRHGANPDQLDAGGEHLLLRAALVDDWDMVWVLLRLGAQPGPWVHREAGPDLARLLASPVPAPDSPVYPWKLLVRQVLMDGGAQGLPELPPARH